MATHRFCRQNDIDGSTCQGKVLTYAECYVVSVWISWKLVSGIQMSRCLMEDFCQLEPSGFRKPQVSKHSLETAYIAPFDHTKVLVVPPFRTHRVRPLSIAHRSPLSARQVSYYWRKSPMDDAWRSSWIRTDVVLLRSSYSGLKDQLAIYSQQTWLLWLMMLCRSARSNFSKSSATVMSAMILPALQAYGVFGKILEGQRPGMEA